MSGLGSLAEKFGAHSEADQLAMARKAFESSDYATAFEIWGPLAHAGVTQAQAYIGTCFSEGWGIDRDFALAARWLTLAADAGDPDGQRNLAALYFRGDGVKQNYRRAAALYRRAAEAGD